MHIDVIFLPAAAGNLAGRTGVVIDVLRATTTVITALSHGCPEILPVTSPEEAIDLARQFGRDSHLVGGERQGKPLDGFDLGNSPAEYTHQALNGRRVILSTTNGTNTIKRLAAAQARPIYLAALVNAPAVTARLLADGAPAVLVCAGRDGTFSLEDAICAGLIAAEILNQPGWTGTDGAKAAAALWRQFGPSDLTASIAHTEHGSYLSGIGYADDVEQAAQVGIFDLIPVLRDGRLVRLD